MDQKQHVCGSWSIICGRPFVDAIFEHLDCQIDWKVKEGERLQGPTMVAIVIGPANAILRGERVALNIIARASGIASLTRMCVEKAQFALSRVKVAGTRKTTPGFRLVEKYALLVGGADPHRFDLSSMVMLKDNHIDARAKMPPLLSPPRQMAGFSTKIEVESRNLHEAIEAVRAGADIVMLDNFKPEKAKETAKHLKELNCRIIIEVSGGITPTSMDAFLDSNDIDIISMSALTQGYPCVDYSLKIAKSHF